MIREVAKFSAPVFIKETFDFIDCYFPVFSSHKIFFYALVDHDLPYLQCKSKGENILSHADPVDDYKRPLDFSAASDSHGSVLLCGLVSASCKLFFIFPLYLDVDFLTYTTCSRCQCRLLSDANGTRLDVVKCLRRVMSTNATLQKIRGTCGKSPLFSGIEYAIVGSFNRC